MKKKLFHIIVVCVLFFYIYLRACVFAGLCVCVLLTRRMHTLDLLLDERCLLEQTRQIAMRQSRRQGVGIARYAHTKEKATAATQQSTAVEQPSSRRQALQANGSARTGANVYVKVQLFKE